VTERLPYVQQNRTVAGGAGHNAQEWRYLNTGLSRAGVAAPADLKVTAGTGMAVNVAAGGAFVPDAASPAGLYHTYNDAAVSVPIDPSHATLGRIDRIVMQVLDTAFGDAEDRARITVVKGTPAGSPAAPALPRASVNLANVTVPAAASSIVAGNIAEGRTVGAGGAGAARGLVWSFDVGSLPGVSRQVTDTTPMIDCFTNQVVPLEVGRLYSWIWSGTIVFAANGAGADLRVRHGGADFETVWLLLSYAANLTSLAGYQGKVWKATATSVNVSLRFQRTVGANAVTINAGAWLQLLDLGAQPV
jgi:hypothetical protein